MKGKAGIPALTAYDYPMAQWLDAAGIPLILVGDSLGMVVLGYPDTTHVTLDDIEHHLKAVVRARPRGLIAADLPYKTYDSAEDAVRNSQRLVAAGAEAVKAEGGKKILPQVRAITQAGISFIGHLGMLPQSVLEEGGYRIKGKQEAEHLALIEDMAALCEAGACAVVLELVTPLVAKELTERFPVPTIGIGSGPYCDGQILVTTDLLGTSPNGIPKHVKERADLRSEALKAIEKWRRNVNGTPPNSAM